MGRVAESCVIFDVASGYGTAAPLVLLVAPLGHRRPNLLWYGVNIQVQMLEEAMVTRRERGVREALLLLLL